MQQLIDFQDTLLPLVVTAGPILLGAVWGYYRSRTPYEGPQQFDRKEPTFSNKPITIPKDPEEPTIATV